MKLITFKQVEVIENEGYYLSSKSDKIIVNRLLNQLWDDEFLVLDTEKQRVYFNQTWVADVIKLL